MTNEAANITHIYLSLNDVLLPIIWIIFLSRVGNNNQPRKRIAE